jgi:alpha-1,2-mannosyltransferase
MGAREVDVLDARRTQVPVRVVVLSGVSLLVWLVVMVVLVHPALMDVRVYRAEGQALLDGLDLYGPLDGVHGVNTYPPFAALLFVPAALPPAGFVEVASVVVNLLLLVVVCWQSVRLAGGRTSVATVGVLAAVALWSEPVTTSLLYGQINLALLALVLWDVNLSADSRWRGVGIGLAAGIKVTPGLLIVYLLLTGRVRAAVTAGGTVLATIGVTALVNADATWGYWTHHLFDFSRMGRLENAANQSVRGWLVRVHHTRDTPPLEMLLVLAVLVAGLAVAALAYRRLGDAWGLPAAALTGLLVSPISWSHHWVWCVPVLAVLWVQARVWVIPTLFVFWTYAVWLVPHGHSVELDLNRLQVAWSGVYAIFAIGFLVLAAVRSRIPPGPSA